MTDHVSCTPAVSTSTCRLRSLDAATQYQRFPDLDELRILAARIVGHLAARSCAVQRRYSPAVAQLRAEVPTLRALHALAAVEAAASPVWSLACEAPQHGEFAVDECEGFGDVFGVYPIPRNGYP